VEAHKTTKDRFADQEMQVGMAGPYTAETNWWYNQTSPRVEPPRKRSRGRTKNTWQRTVLEEAKGAKKTWAEIKCITKNRVQRRNLVDALCSAAEWWDYWLTTCIYEHSLIKLLPRAKQVVISSQIAVKREYSYSSERKRS